GTGGSVRTPSPSPRYRHRRSPPCGSGSFPRYPPPIKGPPRQRPAKQRRRTSATPESAARRRSAVEPGQQRRPHAAGGGFIERGQLAAPLLRQVGAGQAGRPEHVVLEQFPPGTLLVPGTVADGPQRHVERM